MKIKLCCMLLLMFSLGNLNAQEIFLNVDYSFLSGMKYQYKDYNSEHKHGVGFGVGFINPISSVLSIQTGLSYNQYNSEGTRNEKFTTSKNEIDNRNISFKMIQEVDGFQEQHKLHVLTIPLVLAFREKVSEKVTFSLGAGVKYVIPFSYETRIKVSSLNIRGYYPNWDLTIDDLRDSGFGVNYNVKDKDNAIPIKNTLLLSGQLGFDFKLYNYKIYLGGFVDTSVMNIKKDGTVEGSVVSYNPNDVSQDLISVLEQKKLNKVNILNLGVNLRLPISF